MNDFEMRLGAMLSMCVDMAKGIVGEDQFAITLICRSRFTPGHILIGDDQEKTLVRAIEELDRFGKKMLVDGAEAEEVEHTPSERLAMLLQEAAERFRAYEVHHREQANSDTMRDSIYAKDRIAKAEANAEIAARIEALLAEVGFAPAPVETVHIDNLQDQPKEWTPTHTQHHLIDWLSKEDDSAFGECKGNDLDLLLSYGLAEWKSEGDPRGKDFDRVGLTDAGYAKARELGEWKP